MAQDKFQSFAENDFCISTRHLIYLFCFVIVTRSTSLLDEFEQVLLLPIAFRLFRLDRTREERFMREAAEANAWNNLIDSVADFCPTIS